MLISKSHIAALTGHTRATVTKYLSGFKSQPGEKGAESYESTEVLLLRAPTSGGKISNADAIRDYNVIRTEQVELDIEIKKKERIPLEDVKTAHNEAFNAVAGTLKANSGKVLDIDLINEISSQIRAQAKDMIGEDE